jgi:hypothetical protein
LKVLEATAPALGPSKRIAASMGEPAAASAVHHVEQDVRVDIDAVHAASSHAAWHSSHTAHAAKRRAAAVAKHVGWVHEVVAVIVSSTFPRIVRDSLKERIGVNNLLRIGQSLICLTNLFEHLVG